MSVDDAADDTEGGLVRAQHLLDLHRPQEALRALTSTLAQNPENVRVLCLAARAYLELDQPEFARDLAARAAAADPDEEWPLRLLALSLSRMSRPFEAYEAARAAVAKAPDQWQTHQILALMCCHVPLRSEAFAAARRAVELAPLEAETHAVLGCVAVENEDQTTAERALREALRLDPNHAGARNDLGRLQLLRKDHFGAASHFAQAAANDVRMDVAERNIDAALTGAVGRIFFWVWIVMFTLGRLTVMMGKDGIGFGYATLIALVALIVWQIVVIVPAMRGRLGPYLRTLPHRDRMMTATIGLLVFGMIALMVMCVTPPGGRLWPGAMGVVALIGSRILIAVRVRKLQKA